MLKSRVIEMLLSNSNTAVQELFVFCRYFLVAGIQRDFLIKILLQSVAAADNIGDTGNEESLSNGLLR